MTELTSTQSMTYRDAGVDIQAGAALVERIKPLAKSTQRPEVLGHLGGFGALCSIPQKYKEPILVAGTDGVGTKLKLAIALNQHQTIGIDLVAMCANDLLVCGAEPLFFLDYFGTGKLDVDQAATVIRGIADGCLQAGCALIGGETAELPGLYQRGDYDLAGFCVGIVEKDQIITGDTISAGDQLIGLKSNGIHSNGYSLVRKIIEHCDLSLSQPLSEYANETLGQVLLRPTRIYTQTIVGLQAAVTIKGLAHITGGGITENLPRILPDGISARINLSAWNPEPIFQLLADKGAIATSEMLRTFNMGIGMIAVVSPEALPTALAHLEAADIEAWHIGSLEHSSAPAVIYQ